MALWDALIYVWDSDMAKRKTRVDMEMEFLATLKPEVFKALSLEVGKRTDKVWDLTLNGVVWSLVDGAHTHASVLPYLVSTMRDFMNQGAFSHVEGGR